MYFVSFLEIKTVVETVPKHCFKGREHLVESARSARLYLDKNVWETILS